MQKNFFYLLALLIIGILVFYKTFNLAIMGDEWLVMWVVKGAIETTGQWDYGIKLFDWQGYQFGALLMYLLTEYFGTDGTAVYVFSFITRFLAALTLFYFLKRRGCSDKVSFIGSLLFLVTPIGIQTTDWAKNFTSYISIVFFLICIDSIYYKLKSWISFLIFFLTFSISVYINPIRAPGILLTTILLLILQYFFSGALNRNKKIILSFFCSLLVVYLFSKMEIFAGHTDEQRIILTLKQIFTGNFPIETFFGAVGTAILPQPSYHYLGLLIGLLLLWKKYLLRKKYLLLTISLHILTLPILFNPFIQLSNNMLFTLVGIYFTTFMISTFIIELFNKEISEALNTSLPFLLTVCFLIAPAFFGTLIIDPTHRYLIYSALSIPMIVAFSLNQNILLKTREKLFSLINFKFASIGISSIFLVLFYLFLRSEINKMYIYHNQDTAEIIWQQITPFFNNYDFNNRRTVTFFDSSNNGAVVHDVITFGFIYHMGYIYKIWAFDNTETFIKLPIAVDSFADFTSMVTDGAAVKKYIDKDAKPYIYPRENAFYFKIDNLKVVRQIPN